MSGQVDVVVPAGRMPRRAGEVLPAEDTGQDGMAELAAWLEGQTPVDHVDEAASELARRGLSG